MKNNFDDIIFEDSSFFECFDGVECDKNLFLKIWNNRYAALVHESKIKFNLETINDWSESDIFFLIPIDELDNAKEIEECYVKHMIEDEIAQLRVLADL